jgi:hypothetical protein
LVIYLALTNKKNLNSVKKYLPAFNRQSVKINSKNLQFGLTRVDSYAQAFSKNRIFHENQPSFHAVL